MKFQTKISYMIILIIVSMLKAYTFSPSVVTIGPKGNNSSFDYTVSNPEDRLIPIEITIHDFSKDISGKSLIGKEDLENFIIYPAQFILRGGETRGVQVRWIGDPEIKKEKTYAVLVKELDIPITEEEEKETDGISVKLKVLMSYSARLYVAPVKGNSEIVIKSVDASTDSYGKNFIVITCYNKGNIHGKLINHNFIIRRGNDKDQYPDFKPIIINNADIPDMSTAILAKSSREYVIPWPENLPLGKVNVEIEKYEK